MPSFTPAELEEVATHVPTAAADALESTPPVPHLRDYLSAALNIPPERATALITHTCHTTTTNSLTYIEHLRDDYHQHAYQ